MQCKVDLGTAFHPHWKENAHACEGVGRTEQLLKLRNTISSSIGHIVLNLSIKSQLFKLGRKPSLFQILFYKIQSSKHSHMPHNIRKTFTVRYMLQGINTKEGHNNHSCAVSVHNHRRILIKQLHNIFIIYLLFHLR